MSIEPEDLLEEALRSDLPSKEAEARLRRRLLGAGLAIGNGVAATTAAASGAAASGAAASGVAKAVTLSWGLKVGLAAAVAIPSAGLLWEHVSHLDDGRSGSPPVAAIAPREERPSISMPAPAPAPMVSTDVAEAANAEPVVEAPRPRASAPPDEPRVAALPTAAAALPSRSQFAASEADVSGARASTLSEETRLLDRAFAELAAGRLHAAAKLVAEHESRYPQGLLVKERERAKVRISDLSRGE